MSKKNMFFKEYFWQILVTIGGLFVIFLTLVIGAFLVYKGSDTFLKFHHSLAEFLTSANWAPMDNATQKGKVGALIFIVGSLCVCGLALLIATPFALGSSIFMTDICRNSQCCIWMGWFNCFNPFFKTSVSFAGRPIDFSSEFSSCDYDFSIHHKCG